MTDLRIGQGFDLHRLVENRKLILGGVEIPYELGLLGHSDADVLLHAIMNALLGALCLGDIGLRFPPNKDEYKDISSIVLLRDVMKSVNELGYRVVNVDTTVIAQKPKLLPYALQIGKNIAKELKIGENSVSVKATTMEKLGDIGNGLAIAAQAVVLLEKTNPS